MQKVMCEQIYNIWISEPNLIRIIDLRGQDAYDKRHIPGAILCNLKILPQVMVENSHRLLVFLGDSSPSESLSRLSSLRDCVWMDNYQEWFDNKWPFTGASRPDFPPVETSNSLILLETFSHPITGEKASIFIDSEAREVCCVDAHEAVAARWRELQRNHYQLLFLLRTHGPARLMDFHLAQGTRARLCVPREHATLDTDIPLEQGQEMQFGDRVIRIFGAQDPKGQEVLEFDFCGKYRVGGSHLPASTEES